MADDSPKSEQSQAQNDVSKPSGDAPKVKDADRPLDTTAKAPDQVPDKADKPQEKSQEKIQPDHQNKVAGEQKANSPQKKRFLSLPKLAFLEKLPKIRFPKLKISLNLFKFGKPKSQDAKPKQKRNLLWLWLSTILISYIFIGYFLSVLLTMRSQKNLAIAGFVIMGLLPVITAFADYGLMKWGYLISGFLIVGGLIFLIKIKFYFLVLAVITWIGITMIAFVGEYLLKQKHKFFVAIIILTLPCVIGLGLGWQLWRLIATTLS